MAVVPAVASAVFFPQPFNIESDNIPQIKAVLTRRFLILLSPPITVKSNILIVLFQYTHYTKNPNGETDISLSVSLRENEDWFRSGESVEPSH